MSLALPSRPARPARLQDKRALDLALAYLRDAFDVCFYCCAVCESPEQLSDMCSRHVRRCDLSSDPRRQAMGELASPSALVSFLA